MDADLLLSEDVRRGKKSVEQTEEPCAILYVQDLGIQEAVKALVKLRVVASISITVA